MRAPITPGDQGDGLVNLSAELERRLSGVAPHAGLVDHGDDHDPDRTQVLVLFDGLGAGQLDHPAATALRSDLAGALDAPFPSTTTVSLATLVTGLTPAEHGLIAYLLWDPDIGTIINTIHLTSAWGDDLDIDLGRFLPHPNVFERLAARGVESVVVQPANFAGSALTTVLYRGARFEGYRDLDDAVRVAIDVASHPGRLVIVYVPHVDVAAHVGGTTSPGYERALSSVDTVWFRLSHGLPDSVSLIGTADHGHVDIPESAKVLLSPASERDARIWGDPRVLYVSGDPSGILDETGGAWIPKTELLGLWGSPSLAPVTRRRAPDGAVIMPDGTAAFTRYMNRRLVGHHGGLTDAERRIPLLARP
jgi:Type I phosphodiesterase / nucleotide pyrophosphatase